jgi:small nuclear ribonucleoprotein (snRNP)-like protein
MLLVCAMVAPSMANAAPIPLNPDKVHARVRRIGVGNLVGVQLSNGVAYAGKIVSIDAQTFSLERFGDEQAVPVAYRDVVYLQERLSVAYLQRRPVTPETIHDRLLKRKLGNWVAVQLLNGVVFCGSVVSIDENSFGLQLYGSPDVMPVAYSDVVYLQTGLTGGEKALVIALPLAVATAGIATIVAMRNNQPKMPAMPTQPPPVFPIY